jgi:hypothetical protein
MPPPSFKLLKYSYMPDLKRPRVDAFMYMIHHDVVPDMILKVRHPHSFVADAPRTAQDHAFPTRRPLPREPTGLVATRLLEAHPKAHGCDRRSCAPPRRDPADRLAAGHGWLVDVSKGTCTCPAFAGSQCVTYQIYQQSRCR